LDLPQDAGRIGMSNGLGCQELSWDEIESVAQRMIFASRPLHAAIHGIVRDHDLGPRGPWIVLLVRNGQTTPGKLADLFGIGRSLVTAELVRLFDANLISRERRGDDRRLMALVLTEAGEQVFQQVKAGLSGLINTRLRNYSRDEILLCARLLQDIAAARPENVRAQRHRILR
jgi:DNA-binding MarR family transcriptional regulator